jgi:transmembrane sensor
MQTRDIRDLLEKFKDGTITKEELVLLESWYLQWEPEQAATTPEELEKLKDEVWLSIKPGHRKTARQLRWKPLAAAASVLIVVTAGLYLFFSRATPTAAINKPVEPVVVMHDFQPGSHRAILTLSDKRRVVLKGAKNGMIGNDGGMNIYNNTDGELSYDGSAQPDNLSSEKVLYHTLSTPRAGHFQVTLPDGTKAWLNAASSITYPLFFNKDERRVSVTGEVYFEVAHRKQQPFKVIFRKQEIAVLGTHFNVRCYDDEAGMSTTLLSGSVKVTNTTNGTSGLLKPGQQANLSYAHENIDIHAVSAEDAISWKNGYFLFDNQELVTVMKNISRWYNVDVEFKGDLTKERFGGTFSRSTNLSLLLTNMEKIGHVHFELSGSKIIVSKKQK